MEINGVSLDLIYKTNGQFLIFFGYLTSLYIKKIVALSI